MKSKTEVERRSREAIQRKNEMLMNEEMKERMNNRGKEGELKQEKKARQN